MSRVQLHLADGVAEIALVAPERHNALDRAAFADLAEAAREVADAAHAHRARAALVRGEGPSFCAGLDLDELGRLAEDPPREADIRALQAAFDAIEDLPIPVVGALHGACLGAGLQLAAACHLRAVAPDAELGLLEARWGLVPDLGASARLPRLVGLGRATDLALTGRTVDAELALSWGLAERRLEGDPADGGRELAAALAAGPTVALGAVPRLLRGAAVATREEALEAERQAQQRCLASRDLTEASRAARARETPTFWGW